LTTFRRLSQIAPEFIEECESQTVIEKGTAIFKVKALGSQPLSIRWFKDQQTIKYGGRVKMSSDGETCTLKIVPVEKKDEGLYMCVISNKAGTSDCEVLLTVERMCKIYSTEFNIFDGFAVVYDMLIVNTFLLQQWRLSMEVICQVP
jgi:hypothetical protein